MNLPRVTTTSPSIALQALTRQKIVLKEGPLRPNPPHASENVPLGHERRADKHIPNNTPRRVRAGRGSCVPERYHVIANTGIIAKNGLVRNIPIEGQGYGSDASEVFEKSPCDRPVGLGVCQGDVRSVHSKRYLPAMVHGFVGCIRRVEKSGQSRYPVSRGGAYDNGVVGWEINEPCIPEATISITEEINERERDPKIGKVGEEVSIIESNVVVDGRFDHDRVFIVGDAEARIRVR